MKILFKIHFFTEWHQGQADTTGGRAAL